MPDTRCFRFFAFAGLRTLGVFTNLPKAAENRLLTQKSASSGVPIDLVADAWRERQPGAISYGLDYAVVGRNRRRVNDKGASRMYGLKPS